MIEEAKRIIAAELPGMEGWCTIEKANAMIDAVYGVNAQTCVELGVFGGKSLIAMALACKFKGTGVAVGVDPWKLGDCLEGTNDPANAEWWSKLDLEAIYRGFIRKVLDLGLTYQCQWLRYRSSDVLPFFRDGSIDILHQDSNHSEEVSCFELDAWTPKIATGGLLIQDDRLWPSMAKAVAKVSHWEIVSSDPAGNWAILKKP